MNSFDADVTRSFKCLHPTSSKREMSTFSVNDVNYHKIPHGAASFTLGGENVNVMLLHKKQCRTLLAAVHLPVKSRVAEEFLAPLMHRKTVFNMIVPGPLRLFRHAPFIGDGAINCWSATYVSVTDT